MLVALCGFLFFYRLADRDLWSSHEGRAAQNAQSILSEGCWGVPKLFDRRFELQKPPLYYWLVAGFSLLRGTPVDNWSVRLPAALSALATVLVLVIFGATRHRIWAGVIAATILATTTHFPALARVGRIDMPLTLAITMALLGYFQGTQQGGRFTSAWFLLTYLGVAAAVLLKGPIGLVLPAAVIAIHLFVEHRLTTYRSPLLAFRSSFYWGMPLLMALTVPWFVWADYHTQGELFRCFFWYHNVERAFGGGPLRAHEWWFYGPRVLIDLLPWSLLLPVTLWHLWREGRWREDAEARFGFIWLVTVTVVLSCVRFKRADYLLPAYPGAALLLGCIWQTRNKKQETRNEFDSPNSSPPTARLQWNDLFLVSCFLFLVSLTTLGWWFYIDHVLPREEPRRESRSFAAAVRRVVPQPELVIFFRVESHALAFHAGPPIDTILEWENIDIWAGRPGHHYIVMPPECAAEWQQYVHAGTLEEVLSSDAVCAKGHEHPLVLMRTVPHPAGYVQRAAPGP